MFERLGVVTNCWQIVLDQGERFEDLVIRFCRQGFKEIEIRDGEYLRRSPFGRFIDTIEKAMAHYDPGTWQKMCERLHRGEDWRSPILDEDLRLFGDAEAFFKQTAEAVYSYAISFQWLTRPEDRSVDDRRIASAVKLAYLLNPRQPRLRLVSLEPADDIDSETAASNLKRYTTLVPACPVTLAVENALHPAPAILELARNGNALLAYDEANNYLIDGTALNTPEEFWQSVRIEDLASVHLKQKTDQGVLARLEDGFVDIPALVGRLRDGGYSGDLLLEYKATEDPLEDAVQSRAYLLEHFAG